MQDYDSLQNFLEHVALATSIDQEWEEPKWLVLCIRKGLEFEVVFLPGWGGGLFPRKLLKKKENFALEEEKTGLCRHHKS